MTYRGTTNRNARVRGGPSPTPGVAGGEFGDGVTVVAPTCRPCSPWRR